MKAANPGLVATPGPRYFGFVTGGAHPASVAAEWLTATWDQNAFSSVLSPAAAAAEEVVRTWSARRNELGLHDRGTMANFTALAAARHALLRTAGWDVEAQGLFGAPAITVVTSDESHISIFALCKCSASVESESSECRLMIKGACGLMNFSQRSLASARRCWSALKPGMSTPEL